jgi:hypothetical protein
MATAEAIFRPFLSLIGTTFGILRPMCCVASLGNQLPSPFRFRKHLSTRREIASETGYPILKVPLAATRIPVAAGGLQGCHAANILGASGCRIGGPTPRDSQWQAPIGEKMKRWGWGNEGGL